LTTYDQRFWRPAHAATAGGLLFCGLAIAIDRHCGRLGSGDAILLRLEQLDAELLRGEVDLAAVKPPTILGLGFDELLQREAARLPETASVLRAKEVLTQASESWRNAWTPKRRAEPVRSSAGPTLARAAEPTIRAGRDLAELRVAVKRLEAAARLLEVERKSAPTVAWPPRAERRRIDQERSRLSEVGLADGSLVRVLGRTMWGDYLLAVELAGTLLVVGAVGAVAVNTRRQETAA
jgi:Fe2+ transport system protein FeoA